VSTKFTLHTEPNASVPEFTISCRTHGGPATTVQWTVNGVPVQEDRYYETSQLILDTSLNSVYDNRLRVRGRRNGTYNCIISNNIRDYIHELSITEVNGTMIIAGSYTYVFHSAFLFIALICLVAREPGNLTAVISESNRAHVNITVSWESPGDPVTDYVICYQLDGLQRGVTYYISIVALSPHLPSPLVGPIPVIGESLSSPSNYHVLMSLCH
jgi:hypothetical protein